MIDVGMESLGGVALPRRVLAIIPARGGSKRIPRKNIRLFRGKPVLSYSIETAVRSGLFDEIMVSTEDAEIAEVSVAAGAKVPFLRSTEMASDFATTADVIVEVLERYAERGVSFDFVCCLYPAAPLVRVSHLVSAYQMLLNAGGDSVFPVGKHPAPIARALAVRDGRMHWVSPEYALMRSQDLEVTYYDAGMFYWLRVDAFRRDPSLLCGVSLPLLLPSRCIVDIDDLDDWSAAEGLYEDLIEGGEGGIV